MTEKELRHLDKVMYEENGEGVVSWENFTEAEKALMWLKYIGFPNHNELVKRMRES